MDEQYVRNVAGTVCEFLKKTPLIGEQNPAYTEVWNFLNALGSGELSVIETPALKRLEEHNSRYAVYEKAAGRWKSVKDYYDKVKAEEG